MEPIPSQAYGMTGQAGNGYNSVPKVAGGLSYQKQQTPPDIPEAFLRQQQQQLQQQQQPAQGCCSILSSFSI